MVSRIRSYRHHEATATWFCPICGEGHPWETNESEPVRITHRALGAAAMSPFWNARPMRAPTSSSSRTGR